MPPKIQTEFCITGIDLLPEQITIDLGLTPTQTWRLGDPIQETQLRRKHNGWCFSIGQSEDNWELEKSLAALIDHLLPYANIISSVCENHILHCEISCAIYVSDETPIINLCPETISHLAQLNASLDIDIILTE
jgi:hypothetical protein